jgi:PAS domain S-box-containing protein
MNDLKMASNDILKTTLSCLGRRFFFTVVLLVLSCGAATFTLLNDINKLEKDGQALNISGRQRTLTMSIAVYAQEAHNAETETLRNAAIRKMEQAKNQLDIGFTYLTSSDAKNAIPSQIATYYASLYNGSTGIIDHYLQGADNFSQNNGLMQVSPEQALKVFDQGVSLYQENYEAKRAILRDMIVTVIFILASVIILTYALVFLPMKGMVRKQSMRLTLFAKAVEQNGSMVIVTDPNGIISYANTRAISDLGYSFDELIGQHTRTFNAGQTSTHVYQNMWKTIQGGETWQGELLNQRKDGQTFWVQATISPIRDARGQIEGYMSIEQDITLFKNALEENEEVREQLLTAIEAVDDVFALFDKDEHLILWNSRCQIMFDGVQDLIRPGITFRELLEQGARRGQYGEIHDIDGFVESRLASFRAASGETEILLGNGTWLLGSDRKTADGGRVMLRVDITKMKEAEEALREASKLADRANQAKSAFLSSMSHELRTPLNAILGFAQMMQIMPNHPLSKQQERCIDHILKGGKHLLDLINEVLDLAKIEAGKVEVSIEPINLLNILKECVSLIEKSAQDRGIVIAIPDTDASPMMIRADMTRCKQVILNLLSNAVKYNRQNGKIDVSVQIRDDMFYRITITDTGNGIPQDRQHELFKPFNRLGAETSDIEGTGIGLSITKQLVRLMGGEIGFSSTVGVGSEFHIDFILHDLGTAPELLTTDQVTLTSTTSKTTPFGRVLCIEDNPANMSLLEMVLSSLPSVEMIAAETAELGLELARANPPDLVLMDINLPGMNGFAALAALKEFPETASIPVVAMTANAANNMITRGLNAGFNKVLIKPMIVPEIINTISLYLEEKGDETHSPKSAA